jgi:hypothetical protein
MWQAIEWKDSYHGQAWLLSDYDEVSNIPVVCDFEVTGLEMEQWSDPARVAEVVTKKLSAVVDAAVAEEHDRWLTMLAYLGKVED